MGIVRINQEDPCQAHLHEIHINLNSKVDELALKGKVLIEGGK
jgi:hypothetical protein